MKHDITKFCADSLRSSLDTKYGSKLKSGHAHEIVAAVFGYKSRIALLADKKYPIDNLAKAEFILFEPSIPFIDQRLKSLEGLSSDFPPSSILVDVIYSTIRDNAQFLEKIQPSFRELALLLADECLNREMKMLRMDPHFLNWIEDVTVEESEAEMLMTVSLGYHTDAGESLRHRKYVIHLPRIAANIGYGEPEIHETYYSGNVRRYSDEELLKKYPIVLTPMT